MAEIHFESNNSILRSKNATIINKKKFKINNSLLKLERVENLWFINLFDLQLSANKNIIILREENNFVGFSQSCRVMWPNAGGLIGRDKPVMDYSLDRLKRPPVWVFITGIVLLGISLFSQSSGVGNSGEERCIFGHVFPEQPSAYSILKLKRPPLWGPILRRENSSQSNFAGNMDESTQFDDKDIAFFYSAKLDGFDEFRLKGQLPACSWIGSLQVEFKASAHGLDELGLKGQPPVLSGVSSFQAKFKEDAQDRSGARNTGKSARFNDKSVAIFYSAKLHGFDKLGLKGQPPAFLGVSSFQARFKERAQGQSSSRPAEAGGARNVDQQRTESSGGINGRVGRVIGRIGGDGQRRDNGDDEDNDRRMVGVVDNGRGPNEIVQIYLPIVVQTLIALLQIDDAQLSDTDRFIRCFAVVMNLLALLCCLYVIRQPNMNQGNARTLSRMSRIASALSIMGFVLIQAINVPLNLRWLVFLAFLAAVALFWVDMEQRVIKLVCKA